VLDLVCEASQRIGPDFCSFAAKPGRFAPQMRTAAKSFCYAAQGCSKDFAKAISGVPGAGGDAPATSFQGLLKEAKGADGLTNRACYILPKRTG
jgi:hypothetical protein